MTDLFYRPFFGSDSDLPSGRALNEHLKKEQARAQMNTIYRLCESMELKTSI